MFINTLHGRLKTPFFMPDATRGFVKGVSNEELLACGVRALVVNTFHLYLQPGLEIIKKAGGIHKFINWDLPLLSDSGGFQVFSLIHNNPKMGHIYDDKVVFKSPLNGSLHELTPEKAIQIQFDLGVDMMVCLDDCPPNDMDLRELEKSVERTIAWAKRCREEYDRQIKKRKLKGINKPLLFAVIQGGTNLQLRKHCTEELLRIGFDGFGFGARHVDKNNKLLSKVLKFTADQIPDNFPRFALGVGTPDNIIQCAQMGWHMFDCVIPTREGRHGKLFMEKQKRAGNGIKYKTINIKNSKYLSDQSKINEKSKLSSLNGYSKAYLHNLFKIGDPLGSKIASLNNLEFYNKLITSLK